MANSEYEYIDYRKDFLSATDPEEVFANAFAEELIMPEVETRRQFKKHYKKGSVGIAILTTMSFFLVPADVMVARLKNLKLIK